MKKISKIFVIFTFLFIGIYGVKGESAAVNGVTSGGTTVANVSVSNLEGTCELTNYTNSGCMYTCNFSSNGEEIKFGFSFGLSGIGESDAISNFIALQLSRYEDGQGYSYSNTLNTSAFDSADPHLLQLLINKFPPFTPGNNNCTFFPSEDINTFDDNDNKIRQCISENTLYRGVYKLNSFPTSYFKDSTRDFVCRPIKATMNIATQNFDPITYAGSTYNYIYKTFDISIVEDENNIIENTDNTCGLLGSADSKTVGIIKKIYGYIKILIPLLIVALSIVDFLKIIFTGKDDDMKKAINNLIKRIIIAVIFILVPNLVSILINISGITSQYSGVSDGLKTVFCILG